MTEFGPIEQQRMIYRWDLDKTYLQTDFDTMKALLRTAIESHTQKRTIPGASALLKEIKLTNPAAIHILSGSPDQMRRTIEAKLRDDGIVWDSLTLKPSLKQLMKGRFRFIRDQVGYKLRALLQSRIRCDIETEEILFGDDAEADVFVYSLYAELLSGRLSVATLIEVLTMSGVYPDDFMDILRHATQLPRKPTVRRIFVHMERISPLWQIEAYGQRVCPFYNYSQPAFVLLEDGALDAQATLKILSQLIKEDGFYAESLFVSALDLSKRGHFSQAGVQFLVKQKENFDFTSYGTSGNILQTMLTMFLEQKNSFLERKAITPKALDFVDLLQEDRLRMHNAKRRILWRPQVV